jgi:hypothetical protein
MDHVLFVVSQPTGPATPHKTDLTHTRQPSLTESRTTTSASVFVTWSMNSFGLRRGYIGTEMSIWFNPNYWSTCCRLDNCLFISLFLCFYNDQIQIWMNKLIGYMTHLVCINVPIDKVFHREYNTLTVNVLGCGGLISRYSHREWGSVTRRTPVVCISTKCVYYIDKSKGSWGGGKNSHGMVVSHWVLLGDPILWGDDSINDIGVRTLIPHKGNLTESKVICSSYMKEFFVHYESRNRELQKRDLLYFESRKREKT